MHSRYVKCFLSSSLQINPEITFPLREKDVERLKCGSTWLNKNYLHSAVIKYGLVLGFITEMAIESQTVMDAADKHLLVRPNRIHS